MAKAAKLPASKIPAGNGSGTEEFTIKVFAKSGYPKTVKILNCS